MKYIILLFLLCSTTFSSSWENWQYVLKKPMIPHYIDSQNRKWSSNDSTIKVFHNSPFEVTTINIFDNYTESHGSFTITNYINDTLFVIAVFDTPHVLITFNPQTEEFHYFPYPDTLPVLENFGTRFGASPDGSFWLGASEQGMVHFDNGNWKLYDSTNSTIRWDGDPHFSPDGTVWIPWGTTYGTQCGISIFDGKNWSLLDSSGFDIPISLNVSDIQFQKDGTVWLAVNTPFPRGNSNGGIIKYKNDVMTYYDPRKMWQDSDAGILKIDVDREGTLWFDGRGFTKDLGLTWGDFMTDSLNFKNANDLYGDFYLDTNANSLWWEIDQGPGYHWNNGTITKYDTIDFGKQMRYMSYCTSGPDSTIWFYYNWYMKPSVFEVLSLKNNTYTLYAPYMQNLANDTTHAITSDPTNTTFISTNYGISRFDGKNWFAWDSSAVGMKKVTSLFADRKGILWGGNNSYSSANGLVQFDGKTWKKFTMENSELPSPEIYDLAEDTSGTLWISHREGVSTFDGTNWNHWITGTTFPSMAGMGGLARDSSGNMWVATASGAYRYNGSTWTAIDSASGKIPTNYLFDVAVDTAGTLWFGTLKNGVIQFDGVTSVAHTPSQDKDIRKITADYHGNIWAITDSGAAKWNGSSWAIIDSANSDLQDNRLSAIAIGRDGSKWFGTKFNGIAHLTDDESVHTVADRAKTGAHKNLSIRQVGESLAITGANGSGSVALVDLRGRVVWQEQLAAGAKSVTISPIVAKGVYVARVSSGNQRIAQKLFW